MQPGDQALLRHVWRGHVASALPVTVVEDSDERTVLYLRAGTPIRWIDGRLPDWIKAGEPTIAKVWEDTNVLQIIRPGRAHAVWAMWWAENDAFLGWYVNLQKPMRRARLGWDTLDQELDILVSPDLSNWEWKDEEPFAELVVLGFLTPEEADAVRREGEAVIADIEAGRAPFCEPWPEWKPNPSWPIPSLPPDWAVLA